jgi:hypothetical protein
MFCGGVAITLLVVWRAFRRASKRFTPVRVSRGRFEDIKSLNASWVEYAPLTYRTAQGSVVGVGIDFLRWAMPDCSIHRIPSASRWAEITDEIRNREADGNVVDLCITPLFETFERRRNVVFTSPLFFADVGLYVTEELAKQHFDDVIRENRKLSYKEAISRMRGIKSACFGGVTGEISQKLAQKHGHGAKILTFRELEQDASSLVTAVGTGSTKANAVFAESMLAELSDGFSSAQMINILGRKELLYPVGFAVSRGDYQLRNLLNLKILEAHEATPDKIFELLAAHIETVWGRRQFDIREHFVTEKTILFSGLPTTQTLPA